MSTGLQNDCTFNADGGLTVIRPQPVFSPQQIPASGDPEIKDIYTTSSRCGHGRSLGNYDYWKVGKGEAHNLDNTLRGIKQSSSRVLTNFGEGDTAGSYDYIYTVPAGLRAPSDEGTTGKSIQVSELVSHFHGTIASTTGVGDTQPTYQVTPPNPADVGAYTLADGGTMLDITNGTVVGTMTAFSTQLENWLSQMPISVSTGASNGGLPLCSAWGYFADDIPPTHQETSNYQSVTCSVTLKPINGTAQPFAQGIACLLGGFFPESVMITAAGPVSNGTQQVTFQCRYPNGGGYLSQGGLSGQFMSFDANVEFSGRRTAHRVLGSVDGTHIILTTYLVGHAQVATIPFSGYEAANPSITTSAGVHFYPGAENTATLTAVATNNQTTPQGLLEVNNVQWAVGDVVECVFPSWWGGHALGLSDTTYTPINPSYSHIGIELIFAGQGKGVGYCGMVLTGGNPDSYYVKERGPLRKPVGYAIRGFNDNSPTRTGLSMAHPPDPISVDQTGSIIDVGNSGPYTGTPYLADTTAGSTTVVMHSYGNAAYQATIGLAVGDAVSGPGIVEGTTIAEIPDGGTIILSTAATATAINAPISVYAPRYNILLLNDGGVISFDAKSRTFSFGDNTLSTYQQTAYRLTVTNLLQVTSEAFFSNVVDLQSSASVRVQDGSGVTHYAFSGSLQEAINSGAMVRNGIICSD